MPEYKRSPHPQAEKLRSMAVAWCHAQGLDPGERVTSGPGVAWDPSWSAVPPQPSGHMVAVHSEQWEHYTKDALMHLTFREAQPGW
jgi:hypothetical protein